MSTTHRPLILASLTLALSFVLVAQLPGCGDDTEPPITLPDGAATCSPGNCNGCCQGGACMGGVTSGACGAAGLPCVLCTSGELCAAGVCTTSKCNPSNCTTGCCKGDACMPGTAKDSCGSGGNLCSSCAASQKCENQSCGCGPGTCNGCCEAGVCRSGTATSACGTAGGACSKCTSAEICLNGVCAGSGGCSAATCNGCCDGTKCEKGDQDATCGQGGKTCQACKSSESCTSGVCVDTSACSPSSCNGCCSGSQCLSGLSATACGSAGGPCQTCVSGQLCTSGACKLDPNSQWGVVIGSATISTSKSWDTAVYTEPDPYVELIVGSTKGTTTVLNNTYNPKWDEYLFTTSASSITQYGMTVTIYDDDVWPLVDEVIGACQVTVSDSVLASGGGVLSGCGSSGHITKLNFSFTKK